MTDPSSLLDPEAEAILQEVAMDPRSILLRVERPKVLAELAGSGEEIVVRGMTGLTAAEKELLTRHREEAAYLLRLAYYELSEQVAEERQRGLLTISTSPKAPRMEQGEIRRRLQVERSALEGSEHACDAIAREVDMLAHAGEPLIDLPIASLRLVPSCTAQNYVGIEQMLAGQLLSAQRTFESITTRQLPGQIKANFLSDLAGVLALRGHLEEARETAREGADVGAGHADATLSWLASSLQTGHVEQTRESLKMVDHYWPSPTRCVRDWITAVEKQRNEGIWAPTEACTSLIRMVDELAGETAGLVLETLGRRDR